MSKGVIVQTDTAVRIKNRLESVGEVCSLVGIGLGTPLDHYPLGVGLVLNKYTAVEIEGEIVVPHRDDRTPPGVGEVEGVGRAGGGEPDVSVGVSNDPGVALSVEGKSPGKRK